MQCTVVAFLAVVVCSVSAFNAPRSRRFQLAPLSFWQKKAPAAPPAPVVTPEARTALETFRKDSPKKQIEDAELLQSFRNLAGLVSSDELALTMVTKAPAVLLLDPARVQANYNIYVDKWGLEKATGVVTRNPLLFSVPPTGYGSAEGAGDETVFLSYVVDVTRPIGKAGIYVLFGLLAYQAVQGVLPF